MAMNDADERCIAFRNETGRVVVSAEGFSVHDTRVGAQAACDTHLHARARIYLPMDGDVTERLPAGVRTWDATHVEFRPPGAIHSLNIAAGSRLLVIELEPWRFEKLAELFSNELSYASISLGGQRNVAQRLAEALITDSHVAPILIPGLILELIGRAVMAQRRAHSVPPMIREALAFIEEHLSEPITIRRVSQSLRVPERMLARGFLALTGECLQTHVLRTRTERALQLIATTNRSLKEISAHVGFFDQSHMSNQIKRITGLTPTQHRLPGADGIPFRNHAEPQTSPLGV